MTESSRKPINLLKWIRNHPAIYQAKGGTGGKAKARPGHQMPQRSRAQLQEDGQFVRAGKSNACFRQSRLEVFLDACCEKKQILSSRDFLRERSASQAPS